MENTNWPVTHFDSRPWTKGEVRHYMPTGGGCCLCVKSETRCRYKKEQK